MKVIVSIELIGKKDSAKVFKSFDLVCLPVHNSIVSFPSGPNKRLSEDIDNDIKGLKFRIDSKNIVFNLEKDIFFIGTIDDSQGQSLKELVKEYSSCGWETYQ